MCIENLKCVALAVLDIIAIGVLVGGCEPSSREEPEEEVVGVVDGTNRKSVGDFL